MLYLLPNWPQTPKLLEEESMVNLAHLFSAHDQLFELLFLRPEPWLRRILKENDLLSEQWWSVFDAIQDVPFQAGQPVDLEDLGMPADVERIFSQSQVTLNRQDELYAVIKTFKTGFILSVEFPEGAIGKEERVYDDRGFWSYSRFFDAQGKIIRRVWYDLTGSIVMTEEASGQVKIGPQAARRFKQHQYANLDQVILEKLNEHLTLAADPHIVAMAGMAQPMLKAIMADYPVTMLVEEHLAKQERQSVRAVAEQATEIISPTDHYAEQLKKQLGTGADQKIQVIPPYATSLALGVSNETDQTTVMWYVNQLNAERLAVVFPQLLAMLSKENRRRLVVVADNDDQVAHLQQLAINFFANLQGISPDSGMFVEITKTIQKWQDDQAHAGDNVTVENAQMPLPPAQTDSAADQAANQKALKIQQTAFQVFQMLTHLHYAVEPEVGQLKQWLHSSRLLVDLGDQPNLLLQIGAISVAIPQINRHETGYVQDGVNGRIIDQDRALADALSGYLDQLSAWNRTVVANVKLIDQHDDDQLMRLWKKVLTHGR
ncbi:accessory Sec system protein Asp1 [Lacticaseibacillus zeae]|uniref:Accessory Sec system protein Asp1 n=1 Tax=Lacticaseibacillus zeae subsp. silagei TaxID=3068307 RepID=A0ABD7ZC59_LACZE|nr:MULTISPECIES: accessory Sec system protein Asp1 [Lacticaseibacillus]MDE3316938.1 accessory Sec system protein Asp1 [Lacticaseibacillus zeae]OFR98686.1 hypothetical protein HMPREF2861_05735 [Lactobacillus sp. HMSC068F07]WLV84569.1 accessory Sec system protein Asp1 [Lacticaseibacillus sp. NCIMB 15475]WLV87325.1 accessory Sec system protein Asp1 [Lacticaseibacillus sp. NCIMB 15474]